jgi:hypothetical protein
MSRAAATRLKWFNLAKCFELRPNVRKSRGDLFAADSRKAQLAVGSNAG